MAFRIVVDRDLCESNGVCVRIAPDMFVVDDSDRLELLVDAPAGAGVDKAREAVRRCPRRALKLEET